MLNPGPQNRKKYEIIIFGATSFTGKWLLHEVLKYLEICQREDNDDHKFSWAIAGRSFKKMEQLLLHVGRETKKELLGKVDMIQADVLLPLSILEMVQQTQVILNCVGPYQKYGEVVVKACAEFGTHHLDLATEPLFLAQMELKYSKMAERSGAYIIGACGFGSVPADCGALFLQKHFQGDVNSIESFVEIGSTKMSAMHSGSWKSVVGIVHLFLNYILLKGELNKNYDPHKASHKLPLWPIQYRKEVNSWCLLTPFPDSEVMERTQRFILQNEKAVPTGKSFQTRCYLQFPNILYMLIFLSITFVYSIIAQVRCGAKILEKYPKLFTLGMCSNEGPSVEAMNRTQFTFTLIAKGWSEILSIHQHGQITPPYKTEILRIKGTNPCYGATVTILLHAALTLLGEKDKMPKGGGVYSPGIAFANTSFVERLHRNGVKFTIEKSEIQELPKPKSM